MKIGQTYRRRDGVIAHVVERSGNHWRVGVGRDLYSVNDDGYPVFGYLYSTSDRSLIEQVTRVYIAGPMTGHADLNFPAFHDAAALYRARGCFVINPAELAPDLTMAWEDAMRADIAALVTCEMIVLLDGWTASRGATLEHHIARSLGMAITYPEVK